MCVLPKKSYHCLDLLNTHTKHTTTVISPSVDKGKKVKQKENTILLTGLMLYSIQLSKQRWPSYLSDEYEDLRLKTRNEKAIPKPRPVTTKKQGRRKC